MIDPKRMNIIDIIIRRAPKNPRLSELEARLRSLEETGIPLPDVAEFIESLDLVDREELENALSGYLPVNYDFASLIDSLSLVTQEHLDNALAAYVENALEGYAKESALEGFATWTSLNTEVARLDSKIDNIDLSGYATKQDLNDAVDAIDLSGLATKSQVNTEVARLDSKIDNIDLTGFATKSELNAEIARLEAEIEQIASQPSGTLPGSHELKVAGFGDFVLTKGREYFAVTPSEYNTEIYPLEVYNPIGFVAYPVHWGNSGGVFTRVLSFRYLTGLSLKGSPEPSSLFRFRGTNAGFEYPEFQDCWNGVIYTDDSMCGKEKTSYILKNLMDEKYQTMTPTNEAVAGNFPAFAAAMHFDPTETMYSSLFSAPYWYIPSYSEVSQVKSSNTQIADILGSFIEKTGGSVITRDFPQAMLTSTLAEKPEGAGSGQDGWYRIVENGPTYQECLPFNEPCPVRAMIRLL